MSGCGVVSTANLTARRLWLEFTCLTLRRSLLSRYLILSTGDPQFD